MRTSDDHHERQSDGRYREELAPSGWHAFVARKVVSPPRGRRSAARAVACRAALAPHARGRLALRRAVVLATSLAGAVLGLPALADEKPVTIKLWDHHVHDKKFRKDIFKEFNKQNPSIKVEYTSQVGDAYQTILEAAFRSDSPPDIFIPIGVGIPKAIEMGWVIPLEEVAPSKEALQKWTASFPQDQKPFVENTNVFGGKVYSWPIGGQGGYMMLFWNTKLFGEAGLKGSDGKSLVPETWDDLRQFAKKITAMGQGKVYGIVHGIKNPAVWDQDIFYSLATAAGFAEVGRFPDFRTARFDFHTRAVRGPIQLWLDMKADGSVFPGDLSMDDEQAKFRFSQDLAGLIFGGLWVPGGLLAINPEVEFDVAMPPIEKRAGKVVGISIGPVAGTSEYVVSSKVPSKSAAWKVIEFMTSQQYQEGWVKAGGGISVFPQYNKSELFPHFTVAKIANFGVLRYSTPAHLFTKAMNKVWDYWDWGHPSLWETMQGTWIGQLGWDAWDDLERRYNAMFDNAIAETRKAGYDVKLSDFIFPDWDPFQNYPPAKQTK